MWDTIQLTESQRLIRNEIRNVCDDFGREYWQEKDANEEYPHEFLTALADHGWLGMLLPEEYGGAGMGLEEVMVMMEEIAASNAGFGGAQAIHGAIYTSTPLVKYAREELKQDLFPALASGESTLQAFALTEPNAGSDSTSIETTADREGDEYVINGEKIWTSRVDVSDYLLLVARTTSRDEVEKRTRGISLFLVDLREVPEASIDMRSIPKTSVSMTHSFQLWFEDLRVPQEQLIGEEGNGFYHVLDGLNEERLVIAAECVGVSQIAIRRAVEYANERVVFGRPIGQNQGIQHPLAEAYASVQGARQMVYNSASQLGEVSRRDAGVLANTAKYLAAEAAAEATDTAVQTHGGFGVAREYDVERFFRNARLARIAPISQQLALNYIGEQGLGLPRSY